MTIKTHFDLYGLNGNKNTNEKTLVESLVTEAIQLYGMDVKYIPRTLVKEDELFGEDVLSTFDTAYAIEMYLENIDQWHGEGDFLKRQGYSVSDEGTLHVSRTRFFEETGMPFPIEGDLIYFPLTQGLFEIKFVENEQQFYPSGTLPSFKLTIELISYSSERVNTGDPNIDSVANIDQITGVDPSDKSSSIETEADSILDFDEENPFGTY